MTSRKLTVNGVLIEWIIDGVPKSISGDKIARVAQPIARAIDRVAGTKIAGCGGCKKMRARMNAGMTFTQALQKRIRGE